MKKKDIQTALDNNSIIMMNVPEVKASGRRRTRPAHLLPAFVKEVGARKHLISVITGLSQGGEVLWEDEPCGSAKIREFDQRAYDWRMWIAFKKHIRQNSSLSNKMIHLFVESSECPLESNRTFSHRNHWAIWVSEESLEANHPDYYKEFGGVNQPLITGLLRVSTKSIVKLYPEAFTEQMDYTFEQFEALVKLGPTRS